MMTAKDFKAIAEIIKEEFTPEHAGHFYSMMFKSDLANSFCDYFKTTNAKFDKDKFLKACGVTADLSPCEVKE